MADFSTFHAERPSMPLTPAHVAAVLPLPRLMGRYAVSSALVVGSLIPDLPHLLPMGVSRAQSHGLAGLFWFCIPAGLAALVVYHRLIKWPLIFILPDAIRGVLADCDRPHWSLGHFRLAAMIGSIAVGALSHIAWDSLTHPSGAAVEALPILRQIVIYVRGHPLRVYRLLQHGSAVAGIVVVVLFVYRWVGRRAESSSPLASPFSVKQRRGALLALTLIPVAAGIVAGCGVNPTPSALRAVYRFVGQAVPTSLFVFAWLVVVFGLLATVLVERRGVWVRRI